MSGRIRGVACDSMTSLMTWLVPAVGPERDDLVATMDRLAAQHDAGRFEPHVTLVPNVESREEAAATLTSLAAAMTPIDLNFASLGREETYFRALYLVPEPSEQLVALHQAVQRLWSLDPWQFRPHLSVLYSEISEECKRPMIDSISIGLPLTIRFDAIELWAATPEVRDWYRVAKISFTE
jgi:2'-5' RNA ligase